MERKSSTGKKREERRQKRKSERVEDDFLSSLPAELSVRVFSFLTPQQLAVSSLICHEWKDLCDDKSIWRALCVSASRETYKQIVNFKTENKLSWKELYRDYARFFEGSVLLNEEQKGLLAEWLGTHRIWKRQYRASADGFASSPFHKKCDNKGETVTVCRTKDGYIFGGFNPLPWTTVPQSSIEKIKQAIEEKGQPFIFSLVNPHSTPPCRMLPLDSSGEVNFCPSNSNLGPVWGNGHHLDLGIFGYPNSKGPYAWTRLGESFMLPELPLEKTKEEREEEERKKKEREEAQQAKQEGGDAKEKEKEKGAEKSEEKKETKDVGERKPINPHHFLVGESNNFTIEEMEVFVLKEKMGKPPAPRVAEGQEDEGDASKQKGGKKKRFWGLRKGK